MVGRVVLEEQIVVIQQRHVRLPSRFPTRAATGHCSPAVRDAIGDVVRGAMLAHVGRDAIEDLANL